MDNPIDSQRTDNISRFLDGRSVRINPFGENRAADRAYRRAERLVAAVYLLTNHISPEEVIRSSVREEVLRLLDLILSARDLMRSPQSQVNLSIQSSIRKIISLVRIMAASGFISIQNAEMVVEGLDELGNFIAVSQRSVLSESMTISRDDLMDVRATVTEKSMSVRVKDVKDSSASRERMVKTESVTSSDRGDGSGLSVRKQNIVDVLRTGGTLGIRDIVSNLPEYSEKMIQRELLDLVARGTVRKTGLKRWSRYSLSQT